MAIKRGIITFEFMYDDELTPDAEVQSLSIEEVYGDCLSGNLIGKFDNKLELSVVPAEDVQAKLLEYGNDGTFFDEI